MKASSNAYKSAVTVDAEAIERLNLSAVRLVTRVLWTLTLALANSTGSTGSTGSTDSTDSTNSTDSADRTDSTDSVDSTDSTDSADNTDNAGSSLIWATEYFLTIFPMISPYSQQLHNLKSFSCTGCLFELSSYNRNFLFQLQHIKMLLVKSVGLTYGMTNFPQKTSPSCLYQKRVTLWTGKRYEYPELLSLQPWLYQGQWGNTFQVDIIPTGLPQSIYAAWIS